MSICGRSTRGSPVRWHSGGCQASIWCGEECGGWRELLIRGLLLRGLLLRGLLLRGLLRLESCSLITILLVCGSGSEGTFSETRSFTRKDILCTCWDGSMLSATCSMTIIIFQICESARNIQFLSETLGLGQKYKETRYTNVRVDVFEHSYIQIKLPTFPITKVFSHTQLDLTRVQGNING